MKRTEFQKRVGEPVLVKLAGKEYKIYPKPLKQSRVWKEKAKPHIKKLQELLSVAMSAKDNKASELNIADAMLGFLIDSLDEMIDLVFDWEESLPKDEILNNATEDEFLEVIPVVLLLAYPLAKKLGVSPEILASNNPN